MLSKKGFIGKKKKKIDKEEGPMTIGNDISLCTNQVLYLLTSSMLSGPLVPL